MNPVIVRYCLLMLILLLFLPGCTGGDKPKLLYYGDGTMESKYSSSDLGHAVHFRKPGGNWAIKGVRFYAIRQGSGIGDDKHIVMTICDNELQPIREVSVLHHLVDKTSDKWRAVNVNPYILCPDEFWVVLDTNSAQNSKIFVGTDSDVKECHSAYADVGGPANELDGVYDWMIRVEIKKLTKQELDRLVRDEPEV